MLLTRSQISVILRLIIMHAHHFHSILQGRIGEQITTMQSFKQDGMRIFQQPRTQRT